MNFVLLCCRILSAGCQFAGGLDLYAAGVARIIALAAPKQSGLVTLREHARFSVSMMESPPRPIDTTSGIGKLVRTPSMVTSTPDTHALKLHFIGIIQKSGDRQFVSEEFNVFKQLRLHRIVLGIFQHGDGENDSGKSLFTVDNLRAAHG